MINSIFYGTLSAMRKFIGNNKKHLPVLLGLGIIIFVVLFFYFFPKVQNRGEESFENYFNIREAVTEEQKNQVETITSKEYGSSTASIISKDLEQRIPIFVYHSIKPIKNNQSKLQKSYEITPELFEKQLMYLRDNGYTVITPEDIFIDSTTSQVVTLAKKPVMLSFDDGWKNQYEYAYPLLKKYNMKGVFYIYTKPIGAPAFLTWQQIIEMKTNGMVIGSHTITHPLFKKVTDEQLRHEIIDSKKLIEDKISSPVHDFASPYGYSNDYIVSVIKEAGYRTARTLRRSLYHKNILSLEGYTVGSTISDFTNVLNSK